MDFNILKRKNLIAIYLVYNDGSNKQINVDVHYLDDEGCYFQTDLWDTNINKPKANLNTEILVYTANGVYVGKTKIIDTTITLQKVVFQVKIPKKWEFSQLRASVRKQIAIPFKIKYNDGYEINGESFDISSDGISFVKTEPILPLYKKFVAKIELDLSNISISSISNEVIQSEVKYLREISSEESTTYVYKFLTIDSHNINILKILLNS